MGVEQILKDMMAQDKGVASCFLVDSYGFTVAQIGDINGLPDPAIVAKVYHEAVAKQSNPVISIITSRGLVEITGSRMPPHLVTLPSSEFAIVAVLKV